MRRVWLLVAVIAMAATACSSSTSSVGNVPCAPTASGAVCIKLVGSHGQVGDVIGYLSASDSPLHGRSWRLVLDAYSCNPGTGVQPRCAAMGSYPAPTRHGVPSITTHCVDSHGTTVTDAPGCHDTMAQEMASRGDWSGFALQGLPVAFATRTWLCISEQVDQGGTWSAPSGAQATRPLRACTHTR